MKKRLVKLMLGVVLIGISIVYLNAVIVVQRSASPFTGKTSIQVGDMITDSASELLQSAAEAFLFLNEVEIAGRNGLECRRRPAAGGHGRGPGGAGLELFKNIIVVGREAGYEKNRIGQAEGFLL